MPLQATNLATALRRKRIVEAAQRMFAATPYEEVQMDGVARTACVAKPTVYRYFATKEELFLESLDATLEELGAETESALVAAETAGQAVAAGITIVLNTLGRCTVAIRAFDGNDTSLGDRGRAIIRERVKRIRDSFAEVVKRGIQSGEFRLVDPEFASLAILGAVRMTASNVGQKRHPAAAESLTEIVCRGLLADTEQVSQRMLEES
jgi:TetR/AcrR family transcriptional regulator, cholesterol catabolism regulator